MMTQERAKEMLANTKYVAENVRIGLEMHRETPKGVRKPSPMEGIDMYLYIKLGEDENGNNARCIVTEKLIEDLRIIETGLWDRAEDNTEDDTEIQDMAEIMRSMGFDAEMFGDDNVNQIVVTNKDKSFGAACLLNRTAITELATRCNVEKFIVLPSSIHEVILVKANEYEDLNGFSEMVREVNRSEVAENEWLANCAYVLNVNGWRFEAIK